MQLGEQIWTDVDDLAHKVVVLPLGSLEQHGHHLPMLTDSMIGAEVARRAEAGLGDEALFTAAAAEVIAFVHEFATWQPIELR